MHIAHFSQHCNVVFTALLWLMGVVSPVSCLGLGDFSACCLPLGTCLFHWAQDCGQWLADSRYEFLKSSVELSYPHENYKVEWWELMIILPIDSPSQQGEFKSVLVGFHTEVKSRPYQQMMLRSFVQLMALYYTFRTKPPSNSLNYKVDRLQQYIIPVPDDPATMRLAANFWNNRGFWSWWEMVS